MTTPLDHLRLALDDTDAATVLGAVWEVFSLSQEVSDSLAWDAGYDEVLILAAAQACGAGQTLLIPPPTGRPIPPPQPPETAVPVCVTLLEHAHQALTALSSHTPDLTPAATAARDAAHALRSAT